MPSSPRGGRSLEIDDTVGRCRLTGHLGAGGIGELYRARDELIGREANREALTAMLRGDLIFEAMLRRHQAGDGARGTGVAW